MFTREHVMMWPRSPLIRSCWWCWLCRAYCRSSRISGSACCLYFPDGKKRYESRPLAARSALVASGRQVHAAFVANRGGELTPRHVEGRPLRVRDLMLFHLGNLSGSMPATAPSSRFFGDLMTFAVV